MSSIFPDTMNPATLISRRYRPDDLPDLTGRVAIVTGGSSGIGYYDALALAKAGAKVLIISATEAHGKKAESELNEKVKEAQSAGSAKWISLDMTNLKSVDTLAKKLASQEPRLDILLCNAGIGQAPHGLTDDGLERHFEVNNLAHYVLVLRLLPLMQKTAEYAPPTTVRIIMQSSDMHQFAPEDSKFVSKDEVNKKDDGVRLYGRSKLGLIYLIRELVKRKLSSDSTSSAKPILAIAVHPGAVDTDMQGNWTEAYGIIGKGIEVVTRLFSKSAEEGAEASLWAAGSTEISQDNWKDYQGKYFSEPSGKPDGETDLAKNEEYAANFWELCAKCTQDILGEELR